MHSDPQGFAGREIVLCLAVVLGVLAMLAWSAFQKVRASSEDKAVLCPIRQLSSAADQYYLENGVSTVRLQDLVGATNYVKALTPLGREVYPPNYTRDVTITVTGVAGVRSVTYAP